MGIIHQAFPPTIFAGFYHHLMLLSHFFLHPILRPNEVRLPPNCVHNSTFVQHNMDTQFLVQLVDKGLVAIHAHHHKPTILVCLIEK